MPNVLFNREEIVARLQELGENPAIIHIRDAIPDEELSEFREFCEKIGFNVQLASKEEFGGQNVNWEAAGTSLYCERRQLCTNHY